jgi:phage shock protein C
MSGEYKRLYRSRKERMIAGVCGGIGEYFGIDPTIVRLLFVLGTIMGGHGLLAYLILMIVVPEGPLEVENSSPSIIEGEITNP